jgi:pimeloyl-ACP methyl ester carboxylesterase
MQHKPLGCNGCEGRDGTGLSGRLVVDGRRVRHRAIGSGPPVVLVHGLSGSWRWWRPIVPALAERRAVHLVDVPRFAALARFRPGDAAAWLGRFVEAVAGGPVALVGHSLGGLLVAQLAARRPELVERLGLVAPAGIPSGRGLLGHVLPLAAALRTAPARVVGDALRAGPESLLRGALYVTGRDLRPELGAIEAPTLLLWGERDPLVPPRLAGVWLRELPAGRLVVLPGAGHVPMFEAPQAAAVALLAFLEERPDELRDEARR